MSEVIQFEIPGQPVGKARHRWDSRNGGRYYTPTKTGNWEISAATEARRALGPEPWDFPVFLQVIAYFAPPKSWSKKKRAGAVQGDICHTSKPDADNVLKIAKDAFSGVLYLDDKQVCRATVAKEYSLVPRVQVTCGRAV